MRQAIYGQELQLHAILKDLNSGAGDAEQLRALAKTLASNLLATLRAVDAVDRAPSRRIYDMARGARPVNAVEHHDIDSHVVRLCRELRPMPKLEANAMKE